MFAFLLAADAAIATQPGQIGFPAPMTCAGSEPFWTLDIPDGKRALFKDDLGRQIWRVVRIDNAMNRPQTWRVTFDGKERHALIFDEGGSCSGSDGPAVRVWYDPRTWRFVARVLPAGGVSYRRARKSGVKNSRGISAG